MKILNQTSEQEPYNRKKEVLLKHITYRALETRKKKESERWNKTKLEFIIL